VKLFQGQQLMFFLFHRHKVLTYIEYRAVSGVFRTIDPPYPLHPASVSSPRTRGGGYTLAGRRGGGSIFRKTPDTDIGLASYSIIPLRDRASLKFILAATVHKSSIFVCFEGHGGGFF
jgi:hypothetical protein